MGMVASIDRQHIGRDVRIFLLSIIVLYLIKKCTPYSYAPFTILTNLASLFITDTIGQAPELAYTHSKQQTRPLTLYLYSGVTHRYFIPLIWNLPASAE